MAEELPTATATSSAGGGSGGGPARKKEDRALPGAEVVLYGDQLSCVGLQLPRFPRWLAETHRNRITKIDVTGGALHNLSALEEVAPKMSRPGDGVRGEIE